MGLLGDSFDDPRTAAIMALSGSMVRGDFGGGLLGASNAFQSAQESALKRQDLAQQIQLRNIQLQQQQSEWAAIQPALAAYAARQQGGGAAPSSSAPSQPAIPPMSGGPLGSGTFGMSLGGQPAQAPSTASGGSPDPFNIDNIIQGRIVGMMGGPQASTAYFDQLKLPDAVKVNNYYGLPQTDVAAAMQRENAAKGQTLVRNNSTLGRTNPDGSFTPLFTAPDTHTNSNITWSNGVPIATQIPGLTAGIQSVSQAQALGTGEVTPTVAYDASGKPIFSTKATDVRRANGVMAQPGMTGAFDLKDPGLIAGINAMSNPQERANAFAALQSQLSGVTAPAGSDAPLAAPGGGVTPVPQLGAVPNADASQKASADSMRESYQRLQSAGVTANSALDALAKMKGLAAQKNPLFTAGVLGTNQAAINTDAAEYEKQRANVISLLAQQAGTNATDAGRALTGESVPDFGKPKAAIADGLGTLENQIGVAQLKRNLLTPVYQAGDSKKYTTLENQFDQNISPAMIPLLSMQPGPAKAQAVKAAAQDPAMRAKLNWAITNGLMQ